MKLPSAVIGQVSLLIALLPVVPAWADGTVDWSFTPRNVSEIRVAVDWPGQDGEHQPLRALIRRQGDRFMLEGKPVDMSPLASLGERLGQLEPSLGMRHCSDADEDRQGREIHHPTIEIAIRTGNRGLLRLRSDSGCAWMLPWNVTNGELLTATSEPAAGRAIRDLVAPLCPECVFGQQPGPDLDVFVHGDPALGRYAALYAALLSEWRRLGDRHSAAWAQLHTVHLIEALRWMDAKRLERLLGKTARHESGAIRKLAADTLRALRE